MKKISDGYKEPIYVASIPNSDELLVLEQRGVIYLINSDLNLPL